MTRDAIDLGADVGEGGEDDAVVPHVSSVHIACGAHAGDAGTIARTVALALASGAAIGAHPGYPDRAGFGRQPMALTADELHATLVAQIGAVADAARSAGVRLAHVKSHGALYNRAAVDASTAESVARAVRTVSADLIVVGLAGSLALEAARAAGLRVAAEGFADRGYEADGTLRSRSLPGAVLDDPAACAAQALAIVRDGAVVAVDGTRVPVEADTLCIHGDLPGAGARAAAVRAALAAAGVRVRGLA